MESAPNTSFRNKTPMYTLPSNSRFPSQIKIMRRIFLISGSVTHLPTLTEIAHVPYNLPYVCFLGSSSGSGSMPSASNRLLASSNAQVCILSRPTVSAALLTLTFCIVTTTLWSSWSHPPHASMSQNITQNLQFPPTTTPAPRALPKP